MTKVASCGLKRSTIEKADKSDYMKNFGKGLSEELIIHISKEKNEPEWMLARRLESLKTFYSLPLPKWGPRLEKLNLDEITYYANATGNKGEYASWKEVPEEIKTTFEKLGIPQAERKILAGVGSQYESEMIYHNLKKEWEERGVIFEDMDKALRTHEDLVKKFFMTCVPARDHKFAALHGAVWSGGTFLYVPKGVKITKPLQAYFRMNAPGMGQFEHTLIIIEEGAQAHYIEGCSAPKYNKEALHAGCVEIFVRPGARMRYSSVENWSKNTYNLNTKRAIVEKDGIMEWVGGNMGSGVTMLYPCSILAGRNARSDYLGIAFANTGQIQDTGAKIIHNAPDTSSKILMKSLSKGGGQSVYRGLVKIAKGADNCTSDMSCGALILDSVSKTDTYPDIKCQNSTANITHEASAGKVNEEDIFYLMARGIPEEEARAMIVNGFIEPIIKALPLEYAIEMNRLIGLEMENSIG